MRLAGSLVALLLSCAVPAAHAAEPGWSIAQLMAALHEVPSSTARFTETRHVQMLTEPLQSSGRLIYVAPDKLQKETLAPKPERLTVDGDRMTVERAGESTRTVSLGDYPGIGGLVESMRATLAGNLDTLLRFYDASMQGTAQSWSLLLEPKDPKTRELILSVRIAGHGGTLDRIETEEGNGDRSEMTIVPETR